MYDAFEQNYHESSKYLWNYKIFFNEVRDTIEFSDILFRSLSLCQQITSTFRDKAFRLWIYVLFLFYITSANFDLWLVNGVLVNTVHSLSGNLFNPSLPNARSWVQIFSLHNPWKIPTGKFRSISWLLGDLIKVLISHQHLLL